MDRFLILERNGRLTTAGYGLNLLIALTCLGTLIYPLLDAGGILNVNCVFKSITGLPCPSCALGRRAASCVMSMSEKR